MNRRHSCFVMLAFCMLFSQTAEAAELQVTTVGTGGPRFNKERSSPSTMVEYGDIRILVDTGQDACYGPRGEIPCPSPGSDYFGQDAQYQGLSLRYRDNGDGTVTDVNTGLMWQKTPADTRFSQEEAEDYAQGLKLAGYDDWRLPTIKELFSIADLRGNMHAKRPYVQTTSFDFKYPVSTGNRPGTRAMDAQYASSTHYVGMTMGQDRSAFGFNFADGRIKSYPLRGKRFVRCVRGNPDYGTNSFHDNGDGTITDVATGLVWQKSDSGRPMDWKDALRYAENLRLAGHDDWRLPNVKELQSIVDYGRAPDATDPARRGPAIDTLFDVSERESWYWTSTTHVEAGFAYYVCFGQAFSARRLGGRKINAHGAGAVRSDPKEGENRWPEGLGPQADEIRIKNYVRCVRGGNVRLVLGQGRTVGSKSRAPRPGQKAHRSRFILRLDQNRDGKVSRDEFAGPARRFQRLDADGDGFISEEAPEGPPRPQR